MIFLWKILITIICGVLILLISHVIKRRSHPPGPMGFPLVGLLPFKIIQILFSKYLPNICERRYWKQMKEKYGDYWSVEMGGQRIITFSSMEIITEAFVNNGNLFSGRPDNEMIRLIFEDGGIIFSKAEKWKDNRGMAFRALREFGMGKSELMDQICDEGNELIKYLASISSKPINTSLAFVKAVSNVISKLIFNQRNNYNDPEFVTYVKNLNNMFQSKVFFEECLIFPKFSTTKLGRLLFTRVDDYLDSWSFVKDFVKNKCGLRLQSKTVIESPDCVFDYFWKYRYQGNPDIGEEEKLYEIFLTMVDMYNAASETSNGFLIFSCLILGKYQDIQEDLRNELKLLTDDFSRINMDMKKDCPKLLSFMDEIHRYCSLLLKFIRNVLEPCIFKGYKLYPEDILYVDLATIFRDPNLFPNPDQFMPYRFMDESKTRYISNKNVIPFGIGKRICIGENIAKMETFVFLAKIIFTFQISLPEETMNNFNRIFDGNIGVTHAPLAHELNFQLINPI